jgi:hypothetical protein
VSRNEDAGLLGVGCGCLIWLVVFTAKVWLAIQIAKWMGWL